MPRLGWDMQVGSVAEWLKRDGERVAAGEPICMIAGDKATTELEAVDSGILRLSPRSPEPGVEVPVGTVLAYLVAPGEEIPHEPDVAPEDTGMRSDATRRIVASPRARRAAAALGLDWRTLVGSGRGGRILERDVAQAIPQSATPGPRVSGIRRLTAERMTLSARTVAPVTLTTEADASNLVRLRQQALTEHGAADCVPGYTELMVKLLAIALIEYPALNAELTANGIVEHTQVNVAVAVDTPAGLVAPVVHDAGTLSLEMIGREVRRLSEAARSGRSRAEDLADATFTISNLGMYDIDAFTPIVNLPQSAILGLGRIVARPVVVDEATEQVAVRRMLTLSLTFDHRLVDGAPAARFLQRIKHLVERPTLWLFH